MALRPYRPVVLVTGGSSGLGRATVLAFGRRGARVVIADRNRRRGLETMRAAKLDGGEAYFIPTDVSGPAAMATLFERVEERYEGPHHAVNAAAAPTDPVLAPTAELPNEEFEEMMAVTVRGTWLAMRHEIPALTRSGGGTIVNVASVHGLEGMRDAARYAAAKHAVVGLTKSAALEDAHEGVRINAVMPGLVPTHLLQRLFRIQGGRTRRGGPRRCGRPYVSGVPMGRVAEPEEVARIILWLFSDEGDYITGTPIPVDGGLGAGSG